MNANRGESRFSGHPLHPLFTHFPMALWMTSLLWDSLGLWSGDLLWWSFSFWSIAVGLIFAFLAVITGLIDYVKNKACSFIILDQKRISSSERDINALAIYSLLIKVLK